MAVIERDPPATELGDHRAAAVARRLAALAEPTRLKLVTELRERGDGTVQELAEAVGGSLPNVSKHLQVLYQCGIVTRRKEGTFVHYGLAGDAVGLLVVYAIRILGGRARITD
ncbi:MAG TPA: metalloregulator ArsR/SmtB family transcription factor [Thermoleophilaceae bacterium]